MQQRNQEYQKGIDVELGQNQKPAGKARYIRTRNSLTLRRLVIGFFIASIGAIGVYNWYRIDDVAKINSSYAYP